MPATSTEAKVQTSKKAIKTTITNGGIIHINNAAHILKLMKIRKTFIVVLSLLSASCAMATVTETADGDIIIPVENPSSESAGMVKLSVITDNIIRVEAVPGHEAPSERQSLIIVPQTRTGKYRCKEIGDSIEITTRTLLLRVSRSTGAIVFRDKATGRVMLRETANGGKTFKRYISQQTTMPTGYKPSAQGEINWGKQKDTETIAEADRTGYTWRALFDSPADEALYGLGQHQSEEMNYKGRNEELYQYNTKVSVPFVMSTKGYGLLWDSYSYCRWGNPHDYQQLCHAFKLRDKQGTPGALTGTYTDKKGRTIVRREDSIYFEHSGVIGNLPKGFSLDGSKVTYEGTIEAGQTATYHFILYYAGYIKVYMADSLVVPERWRTAWNPNSYKFTMHLEKGRTVPLRIEWQPDGSTSYCGLRAAVPQTDEEQGRISIWSEMAPSMDYYFIAGNSMDSIISGYRRLTGRAQVMPKWALGFWQSRERYKTQRDVLSTMAEFRRRNIPIDNIVQDWNYWEDDQWGSHQFDSKRYPDPQQMLDSIHSMHGRFMISVWPKFYCNTDNYKALDANGWMYRQAVTDSIRDWVGPGYIGSFYDAYSAGARKLFWHQIDKSLYSKFNKGIDAWWMDASEPNVRDCTPMEYRKALCGPTALGTSDEYFNAYSIVNADAIYNGQRSVDPNRRVFLLTRSGFAGLQRYSTATWSGDIGTRWEDMRAQMTAGINFSMSGIPFWGMDQGGFCVERRYVEAQKMFDKTGKENADLAEWRELQARWNQFGCFIPLYRTHGQWPLREVWNIAPEGHPAYESITYYHKLRYRLMPYLYSMAGWVWLKDYTMLRGLAMDFASDHKVLGIGDQWMFGPALMACPVSTYKARSRKVYLPKQCGWYNLYTGNHNAGGQQIEADAPYGRIPVFVREGAILPFGPALQWSDEKQADTISLYVYAGCDGKFTLYEDEGTNYNYEKGMYSTIDILYNDKSRILTIGRRHGSYKGMPDKRLFRIILVTPDKAVPMDPDRNDGKAIEYNGKEINIKL